MGIVSSIFSKIKSIGKQNENSLFKEERFIKLYNSCYELLKIQIELSVKYSKLRNKNSILSNALLDRDWVYGYICGYIISCFKNSYLKDKDEIYTSVICGILHLLGIRGSKVVKEHISTVNNYFINEIKNKDSEYYKGGLVGYKDYKDFTNNKIERTLELSHYLNTHSEQFEEKVAKKVDVKSKHLLKLIDNFLKKNGKKLEEKRNSRISKDKLSKKQIIENTIFFCSGYIELQFVMCEVVLESERKNEKTSIKDTDWVAGYIFGLLDATIQVSIIKGDKEIFNEIYKRLLLKFKIFNKKKVSEYDLYIENINKEKLNMNNLNEFDKGLLVGGKDMWSFLKKEKEIIDGLSQYIQDIMLEKVTKNLWTKT
jgi:hypothetical protein